MTKDKEDRCAMDADNLPPCKVCTHAANRHDEEFGNCYVMGCKCTGYEEAKERVMFVGADFAHVKGSTALMGAARRGKSVTAISTALPSLNRTVAARLAKEKLSSAEPSSPVELPPHTSANDSIRLKTAIEKAVEASLPDKVIFKFVDLDGHTVKHVDTNRAQKGFVFSEAVIQASIKNILDHIKLVYPNNPYHVIRTSGLGIKRTRYYTVCPLPKKVGTNAKKIIVIAEAGTGENPGEEGGDSCA